MTARSKPELCGVSISTSWVELSKVMSSIWPRVHKRAKGNRFGGNTGKDIKRVSGDNVREVRDHGNAVPGIGSLIGRGVNGWGRVRKSRGRVRTYHIPFIDSHLLLPLDISDLSTFSVDSVLSVIADGSLEPSVDSDDDPLWAEAMASPERKFWIAGAHDEIRSLEDLRVFTLVPCSKLPKGK